MAASAGVLPLCHPNNFRWDSSSNQLVPVDGQQRKTLQLVPEALDSLARIKDAIAVICICGPARSGKSYVLSQLQDGAEFELGHTMTSQTTGIWMSREPTILTTSDGRRVRLILLDTEGLGASCAVDDQHNDKWDNQMFTLSALISSLLIYNSQGVPNANDLDKLNFIANLSESVYAHAHESEEGSSALANFRNSSPDFFWLVRDLVLQPTDKHGRRCDIKTYLYENVLRTEDENGGSDTKSRRNAVRRNIREMFRTFDAYGLPVPSSDPDVIQNLSSPRYKSEINEKFTSRLHEVKSRLLDTVKPKRVTGATFVTGPALVELIEMYVKALNEKGCVPEWSTAWENAVRITAERALHVATAEYRKRMESVVRRLPCETEHILNIHNDAIKRACELFSEETKMTTGANTEYISRLMTSCAEYDNVSHECVGGILMEITSKNLRASETFCEELRMELQRKHIDPVLENINSDTTFESLLNAVDAVNTEYDAMARGPCKGSVRDKYVKSFTQRLKEAANDISKMKDYDVKVKKQMEERLQQQAEMQLIAQQSEILSNNMKMADEQQTQQLNMMQEQQKRAEEEMNRLSVSQVEDKERLMEMMKDMKESQANSVKALARAQEQHIKTLSEQRECDEQAMMAERRRLEEMMKEQEEERHILERQREQHRMEMEERQNNMLFSIGALVANVVLGKFVKLP